MKITETDETITYNWDDLTWEVRFEKEGKFGELQMYNSVTVSGSDPLPALVLTELLRKVVEQMGKHL